MDKKNLYNNEFVNIDESMIINEKDIYYNKKAFDNGDINLCFITGHSGSGKSTMGLNATKGNEDKVDTYSLDDLQWSYKFSDDNLKEYGDLIYSFFKGKGKKYRIPYRIEKDGKLCGLTGDDVDKWLKDNRFESLNKYINQVTNAFVDYSISYANSHKNKKYIIEGIQLFLFIDPEKLKDYAVYIKGTSALISTIRGIKRDTIGPTRIVDNMKMFNRRMKDIIGINGFESRINKYKKYFKNLEDKEPVNESFSKYNKVYYALTAEEAKKSSLKYTSNSYTNKGVNVTLSGLKKFIKDNNMEDICPYYTVVDINNFTVDDSVYYDKEYDMISVKIPFEFKITNKHKLLKEDKQYSYENINESFAENGFYFYHIIPKDANIDDGISTLQYQYDNNDIETFRKNAKKYREKLTGAWGVYYYCFTYII